MRIFVYLMIAVSMVLAPWAHAAEKAERLKVAVTIAPLKTLVDGVTKINLVRRYVQPLQFNGLLNK